MCEQYQDEAGRYFQDNRDRLDWDRNSNSSGRANENLHQNPEQTEPQGGKI